MKTKTGVMIKSRERSVDTIVKTPVKSTTFLRQFEGDYGIRIRYLEIQDERSHAFPWMNLYLMFVLFFFPKTQLEHKVSTKKHPKTRKKHKTDDDEYVIDAVPATNDGGFAGFR